jgi:hypothetical protein
MPVMPGKGSLPPHVVAKMIGDAKAQGKCARVSTMGYVCTNPDGHAGVHVATDQLGNTADSWIEAPDAWSVDDVPCSPKANTELRQKAARADSIYRGFQTMVRQLEEDPRLDFVEVWELVERLVLGMPGSMDYKSCVELMSYFVTRGCWSDPDTIPKRPEL